MATEAQLRDVVARAVGDGEFRRRLKSDPGAAAKEMHVDLTPEQTQAVKNNSDSFEANARELHNRIGRRITAGLHITSESIDRA